MDALAAPILLTARVGAAPDLNIQDPAMKASYDVALGKQMTAAGLVPTMNTVKKELKGLKAQVVKTKLHTIRAAARVLVLSWQTRVVYDCTLDVAIEQIVRRVMPIAMSVAAVKMYASFGLREAAILKMAKEKGIELITYAHWEEVKKAVVAVEYAAAHPESPLKKQRTNPTGKKALLAASQATVVVRDKTIEQQEEVIELLKVALAKYGGDKDPAMLLNVKKN